MAKRRIHDDELHAQFVTFSCDVKQPFWQPEYYPFSLYTEKKALEKLDDMHKNPVTAGLVEQACDWQWSSARYDEQGKSVGVPLGWVF